MRRPSGEGMLSSDSEVNPHFYNWTKVELHYCTSDLYFGNRTQSTESDPFVFHGSYMVSALLRHLVQFHQLDRADKVILSGSSAGFYGVINGRQYLRALLPNTEVYSVVDSAYVYLTENVNINDCNYVILSSLQNKAIYWNNAEVVGIYKHEWWRDVTVPTFFVMNRWDNIMAAFHCIQFVEARQQELEIWSNAFLKRIEQILADTDKIGLFIPGCVGHGILNSNNAFSKVKAGTFTVALSDNLWDWLHHIDSVGEYTAAVDTCAMRQPSLQCNPTCLVNEITETVKFLHF